MTKRGASPCGTCKRYSSDAGLDRCSVFGVALPSHIIMCGAHVPAASPAPTHPRLPAFLEALQAKLAQGAIDYGDASFSRDPLELIDELQKECLDMAGWGFVLWVRLEAMKEAFENSTGKGQ